MIDLLADGQAQTGIDGATVSSVVIGRLEVGRSAVGITSLADGLGARVGSIRGGDDGEAVLGELGASAHVDAREVPEDSISSLGVLELQDVGLVGVGSELNGDTAAVRVGLPLLRVGTTIGREDLHGANVLGNGPSVDILVQGVGDQNTAAIGSRLAADHATGHSGGKSSENSGDAERLGEHHFECDVDCSENEW